MRWKLVSLLVAACLLGVFVIALLWKGAPLLLSGLARLVPVSLEERLGAAVTGGLASGKGLCDDPATERLIASLVKRLEESGPKTPYQFRVRVVKVPMVNAMAAPGGHIVLFSGLLDRMETPEQVAAVLAHEMQHVIQRHTVKSIIRAVGLQAVLSLVLGDPGVLGEMAGNLGVLAFLRGDEQSADDAALEMLRRAGIPPGEMVRAFERLRQSEEGQESAQLGLGKYLSTHPPLEERIARVRERSRNWNVTARPLDVPLPKSCLAAP
jgi:predicted Zn-dependent protease